ncbi:hypothetical protein NPIL_58981, partial [Nephila pilipes]
PDLDSLEFFLFGCLKAHLRGYTFDTDKALIGVKVWCLPLTFTKVHSPYGKKVGPDTLQKERLF